MEERRVSKGVIRRRASVAEPEESKVNLLEPAPSADAHKAERTGNIEKTIPAAAAEVSAAAGASVETGKVDKEQVKSKQPQDTILSEKNYKEKEKTGKIKKGEKNESVQKPDVLSVIKTLDVSKVKALAEEAADVSGHKKPVKKEEIKKGPQLKFSKNEKFIDTSEEGESFVFRKHNKRKFGGKHGKQAKHVNR